ncbi:MAG: nuclear transport factor 2 family protein [Chitinophagaceae bacterium]
MKLTTLRIGTLAIVSLILSVSGVAQTKTDEEAVRTCLENYMSGDGNRMEKAFHPSATMKYIDAKTNEFKDVPIADFIARVKANTTKQDRKIEIVSMNIEGDAATGKIKIETGNAILYDYMNMLKIDGEWKIVSKIFSRKDK